MGQKHFSIHGHFYQPPRIDPRLKEIPQEKGAQPYKNWTERIYHECYLPNAKYRNFEKISFNFGPTLTSWLARNHPDTLQEIVWQENKVYAREGVSNAMAQPYIHAIFPLIARREKETLVRWGIDDYEHHFGHKPAGMWLPETAVDLESLQVLAEHGIQFTILAPWQAKNPSLDITKPYQIKLKDGKEITVFFYNSFLSSEISFNTSATMDADMFISDWLAQQAQNMPNSGEQLFLAASDGELYGHHMKEREQFLDYLMNRAVNGTQFISVFPAVWLRDHPPEEFAEINENTSWSCHHGIERWKDVCGDAPTAFWKKPLREFLDRLAASLDEIYETFMGTFVEDPWQLRDAYIQTLMGPAQMETIINTYAKRPVDKEDLYAISNMLEAQFNRLRMHSSDAWFFFDFDSIEPLNGLKYAVHAVCLARDITGKDASQPLLPILADAMDDESGLTGDVAFRRVMAQYT